MTELIDIADETQRLIEASRQLAQKSAELERAAEQLREANERLRELDARKDDFLSQVSHELRTPMTSVRSFSEILLSERGHRRGRTGAELSLRIIHEESLRLTRLLDEILDVSRLESGLAGPAAPARIDPRSRGHPRRLDTFSGVLRKNDVTLEREQGTTAAEVMANEDRLRQVLINLLSNAVKYNTAEEQEIRIRTGRRGTSVTIDVIDNGGGVTRAEAGRVFDKFTRGARAARDQGAGLGLPISRAILRSMGGDLTLEFNADGTSFFRLRLPRTSEAPQTPD